jgi:hypothetical membrane protein
MRVLAAGGLVGPVILALITILCAAQQPHYSHIHNLISELGVAGTPWAILMNYGGFVPAGLLLVGFGVSLRDGVPRGRTSNVGTLLILFFGFGIALSGLFSCDVGCPQFGGSLENLIHDRLAPVTFASGGIGVILLGWRFRGIPSLRRLWVYSVASGILGLSFLVAVASSLESRELTGLWQRLLLAVLFIWCAVVGYWFARGSGSRAPLA